MLTTTLSSSKMQVCFTFHNFLEEIYYNNKQKSLKIPLETQSEQSKMRGAIIVAPSRELLWQIYALIRRIDVHNKLKVNRVGSSVQLFSAIVEHMNKEGTYKTKREVETDQLDSVSVKNIVNNAKWELNDIMLVTPMILQFLIDDMKKYACLVTFNDFIDIPHTTLTHQ